MNTDEIRRHVRDLFARADDRRRLGDTDGEMAVWRECLSVCEEVGDRDDQYVVLRRMAEIHRSQEAYDEAMSLLDRARGLLDPDEQPLELASVAREAGQICLLQRAPDRAIDCFRHARALCRAAADRRGEALAAASVGRILFDSGQTGQGVAEMLAALALFGDDSPEETDALVAHIRECGEAIDRTAFKRLVEHSGLPAPVRRSLLDRHQA